MSVSPITILNRTSRHRIAADDGFTAVELLIVVLVIGIASAFTVPLMGQLLSSQRITGDIRGLSNGTALAKMRAAARFGPARFYVDTAARTYRLEVWRKTGTPGWEQEGPTTTISSGVTFSFAGVTAAPPNTQGTIGQADLCRDDSGATISSTACVVFNSRGLPVDTAGNPTGTGAFYIRDANTVYGVTVSATGMVRTWRTAVATTPNWVLQ